MEVDDAEAAEPSDGGGAAAAPAAAAAAAAPAAAAAAEPGAGARFWDLGASEAQLETDTQRERAAAALRLGYHGVAFAHQAGAALTDADRCALAPTAPAALRAALGAAAGPGATSLRQLSRLNLPVDDPAAAQAAAAHARVVATYDLLAAQPRSERGFALACTTLDVDLISLDLGARLPYRLKPALVAAALARGVHFELAFGRALREPAARGQFFANARALCREARGRGVVVASGARAAMELRGPADAANLATFCGLTARQARRALAESPAAVVAHARARRAHRGFLTLKAAAAPAREAAAKRPRDEPPA
jgi:ribonuclease P/MRP protein subunit RPP1